MAIVADPIRWFVGWPWGMNRDQRIGIALEEIFAMRSMRRLSIFLVVLALVAIGFGSARAVAALTNPGLEAGGGAPDGWTLTQSVTGLPGALISVVEQRDQGNEPGDVQPGLGLTMIGFGGNTGLYAGQERGVNVTLSRTVAVGASRTFTLTGHSYLGAGFSGIVDELGGSTPLGDYNLDTVVNAADYTIWQDTLGSTTDFRANGTNEGASLDLIDEADYQWWKDHFGNAGVQPGAPSPTESFFRVEFLNASNAVLGTHSIDLRDDSTPGDPLDPQIDVWRTHTLAGIVSPAGTTQARVSAITTDMVDSHLGGQDMFWDNFSLNQTSVPFAGEKLGDAATRGLNTIGAPGGWVVASVGGDNISFSGAAGFAANSGNIGMWLRAFNGGDGKLLQTVAATPGASYDFSAFSKWEANYRGADPASSNETFLTLEYLDNASAVISTLTLDLKRGPDGNQFVVDPGQQSNDNVWRQLTLDGGTAPVGTAFVRVSAGATGMVVEGGPQLSAFFDDFLLTEMLPGAGSLAAVPEPSSLLLVGIALAAMFGVGRRRG